MTTVGDNRTTEVEDEPLTSNQLLQQRQDGEYEPMVRSKETPASDNKGGYDEEFEEEWAGMSILTQYIGPTPTTQMSTWRTTRTSSQNWSLCGRTG